jgi:hypothetical protein
MRAAAVLVTLSALPLCLFSAEPPVKMGLWEKTSVFSGASGESNTLVSKSCITPAEWQKMVDRTSKPRPNCKMDVQQKSQSYTFKGTCDTAHTSMALDGSQTIQDSEHIVSDSHSVITIRGQQRETKTHSTSRFLSASCGNITPGGPEVEDK